MQVPIGLEEDFKGLVDLVQMKALYFHGSSGSVLNTIVFTQFLFNVHFHFYFFFLIVLLHLLVKKSLLKKFLLKWRR